MPGKILATRVIGKATGGEVSKVSGQELSPFDELQKRKVSTWNGITYELLHAGALGSMLFDFMDPLRSLRLVQIPLLFLVGAFVADFWHLRVNLSDFLKPTPVRRVADGLIAALYTASYFMLSHLGTRVPRVQEAASDYLTIKALAADLTTTIYPTAPIRGVLCMGFLTSAIVAIAAYNARLPQDFRRVDATLWISGAFSLGGFLYAITAYYVFSTAPSLPAWCSPEWFLAVISLCTILTSTIYSIYVIYFAKNATDYARGRSPEGKPAA